MSPVARMEKRRYRRSELRLRSKMQVMIWLVSICHAKSIEGGSPLHCGNRGGEQMFL